MRHSCCPSNQFCITTYMYVYYNYSSYMSFAFNKLVAVPIEDSIRTCKPHAVLYGYCNYMYYIHVHMYNILNGHACLCACMCTHVIAMMFIHYVPILDRSERLQGNCDVSLCVSQQVTLQCCLQLYMHLPIPFLCWVFLA